MALGGSEERQLVKRQVRCRRRRRQQAQERAGQPCDRGGVEEIAVVLDRAGEPPLLLEESEGEVELGDADLDRHPRELEARERQRHGRVVLQDEHHLEERRTSELAGRAQLLHQALERHVLVLEGAEDDLARPGEERPQARPVRPGREIEPQHESVDEETDQPLHLGTAAAGDRRSHRQVLLAAQPCEQGLEGGEQGHKKSCPGLPGEALDRRREAGGEDEG